MAQPDTQETQRKGNTLPRARKWIFVLHNWSDCSVTKIIQLCEKKSWKYLFSDEVGKSGATPHLQGYIEHRNPIRGETLKEIDNGIHLEVARGDLLDQFNYIEKEGRQIWTNIARPYVERPKEIIECLRYWQKKYDDILSTTPEERKIYWIYDPTGNSGKSEFCRYMMRLSRAMWIKTAKASDIKMLLMEHKNCRDLIFDLPRKTTGVDFGLLEELKDGLIFSGKYEGGIKEISIPHIIVMSNQLPPADKLSADRLIIDYLDDDMCIHGIQNYCIEDGVLYYPDILTSLDVLA